MKPRSIVGPMSRNSLSNDRFFKEKSDTPPFSAGEFILCRDFNTQEPASRRLKEYQGPEHNHPVRTTARNQPDF
jgi:hypothetical protein